ncbi:MAG: hypothetical protein K2K89_10635 [Ruminococcus sp.]|nr:hypothetical protein [Ruminococcus sp.]
MVKKNSMKNPETILTPEQEKLINKMLNEISRPEIQVISFRMKDVLTVTPFSAECDIFMLMEDDFRKYSKSGKNFAEIRTAAYDTAKKKSGDVSLENIYKIISKTGKIKDTSALMQCECALIENFTIARKCGKMLYRQAISDKKKIIIVCKKIYPEELIKKILSGCGYNNYDDIIFSDDFGDVLEKSGVSPSELMHIGGNVEKDVEIPVLKGAKALLLSPEVPLMVKSGRLRGFIQSEKLLDIDSPEYMALRCAFGLYSIYAFDVPQNKVIKSDFCNNAYMIGFIVFGTLSLVENFTPETELHNEILSNLEKNPKIIQGMNDFKILFEKYFSDYEISCSGCELPFIFLENHAAPADRMFFRACISDGIYKKWTENITDPEILPVYSRPVRKNALSRLADKLFPHGTKVRTIADRILAKSHL